LIRIVTGLTKGGTIAHPAVSSGWKADSSIAFTIIPGGTMLNGKIVSLTLAAMLFSTAAPLLAFADEPDASSAVSVSASTADTAPPQWPQSIRYLALGDSLAAGMTPTGSLDKSYAD